MPRSTLPVALSVAALSRADAGCVRLQRHGTAPAPPPQRNENVDEDRDAAAAVLMGNTFQTMQRLSQAPAAEQAELLAAARCRLRALPAGRRATTLCSAAGNAWTSGTRCPQGADAAAPAGRRSRRRWCRSNAPWRWSNWRSSIASWDSRPTTSVCKSMLNAAIASVLRPPRSAGCRRRWMKTRNCASNSRMPRPSSMPFANIERNLTDRKNPTEGRPK